MSFKVHFKVWLKSLNNNLPHLCVIWSFIYIDLSVEVFLLFAAEVFYMVFLHKCVIQSSPILMIFQAEQN